MNTRAIPCGCRSAYHDDTYGPGMRLHNLARGKGQASTDTWRCTVCGDKKFNVPGLKKTKAR